jgi:hypothetical protein
MANLGWPGKSNVGLKPHASDRRTIVVGQHPTYPLAAANDAWGLQDLRCHADGVAGVTSVAISVKGLWPNPLARTAKRRR